MTDTIQDSPLVIAGKTYSSRLLVGSGKYSGNEETRLATEASGAEIVTVAVRRSNMGQKPDEPNLLDAIPPEKYTILPNTAGCYTVDDAVRTCRLARELLDGHNLVKLEVLADEKTLYPDVIQTLKAAEILIKEGFSVSNTKGEDLGLDTSPVETDDFDIITAFQIFEHMVAPFNILKNIKEKKLIASVPLKLWFTSAYRNKNDD